MNKCCVRGSCAIGWGSMYDRKAERNNRRNSQQTSLRRDLRRLVTKPASPFLLGLPSFDWHTSFSSDLLCILNNPHRSTGESKMLQSPNARFQRTGEGRSAPFFDTYGRGSFTQLLLKLCYRPAWYSFFAFNCNLSVEVSRSETRGNMNYVTFVNWVSAVSLATNLLFSASTTILFYRISSWVCLARARVLIPRSR